jgi:hypothetical protein
VRHLVETLDRFGEPDRVTVHRARVEVEAVEDHD